MRIGRKYCRPNHASLVSSAPPVLRPKELGAPIPSGAVNGRQDSLAAARVVTRALSGSPFRCGLGRAWWQDRGQQDRMSHEHSFASAGTLVSLLAARKVSAVELL